MRQSYLRVAVPNLVQPMDLQDPRYDRGLSREMTYQSPKTRRFCPQFVPCDYEDPARARDLSRSNVASRLLKRSKQNLKVDSARGRKRHFLVKVLGWLGILGFSVVLVQAPLRAANSPLFIATPSTNSSPSEPEVTTGWNPSPDPNVVGYYLCWGLASGQCTNFIDVGNITNATLGGFTTNVLYYFTVVAYDAAGDEAVPSNEIQYMAPNQTGLTPPTILTDLTSQNAVAGSNVFFQINAAGSAPLSYQWLFNGANLSGATVNPLILSNVTSSQSGTYQLIVTNALGRVTSSLAILQVLESASLRIGPLSNGALKLIFGGAPNQSYAIQYSTNLEAGWRVLATVTSDPSGILTYIATPSDSSGFFRVGGQ